MELRSGHIAGPPLQLPSAEAKAGFEEGVGLVFSQWTALCLAVEQEWGGPDSEDKANHLIEDTIQWFYKKKEHYVDDLEMELTDALLEDFQLEAEDGSPRQVASSLVALYHACCRNDAGPLQQLRQRQAAAATNTRASRPAGGADDDDDDSSCSGSDDDGMDEDMSDAAPAAVPFGAAAAAQPPPAPVVDADGFELVQKRRGRR